MNHHEIQKQLDAIAGSGGGTYALPEGTHTCGTLHLRTGVHLQIPEGCKIVSSDNPEDFPTLDSTVNETGTIRALIHANGCEDVTLSGKGTIDGQGITPLDHTESSETLFRPELIYLKNCRNVSIKDLHLVASSFWTLHLLRCEDVDIDSIIIRNRIDRINTDGIDPDGCKRVRIRNCDIESGDDCIVIKSTEGDDCEDIEIRNCRLKTTCSALKIGTETLGDFSRITFEDCRIEDSTMGFGIFLKDGGSISDISVRNVAINSPGEFPLFIDHTPRFHGESPEGRLSNLRIENCQVTGPGRIFVQGGEQTSLEGLSISGLSWTLTHRIELGKSGKPIGSVRSRKAERDHRPEWEPYQFTLVNVKGLSLRDLTVKDLCSEKPDRGFLYAENVKGRIQGISMESGNWISPDRKENNSRIHLA